MKISIYELSMEKVHSVCDEQLKILDVNADNMTISIEISTNIFTVSENMLRIGNRFHEISINDYRYIIIR